MEEEEEQGEEGIERDRESEEGKRGGSGGREKEDEGRGRPRLFLNLMQRTENSMSEMTERQTDRMNEGREHHKASTDVELQKFAATF